MFYTQEQLKQINEQPLNPIDILELYSFFQNNQTYKTKFFTYRDKIINHHHDYVYNIVRIIRNILEYSTIRSLADIAKVQKQYRFEAVGDIFKGVKLSEFSKLLVMRFIRQTYFYSNYLYMTFINLELAPIFQKIGFFDKSSSDDQRGRKIFFSKRNQSSKQIFKVLNDKNGQMDERQLQSIGFSLHKLTLEILQMNAKIIKYLPYHKQNGSSLLNQSKALQHKQQNLILDFNELQGIQTRPTNEQKLNQCFYNELHKIYLKMNKQKVSFPLHFTYFKSNQPQKIQQRYNSFDNIDLIKKYYYHQFSLIWHYVDSETYLYSYCAHSLDQALIKARYPDVGSVSERLRHVGMRTNDRFFIECFNDVVYGKLKEITAMQQSSKAQNNLLLKQIININAFLTFLLLNIPSLEILYQLQHNYVYYLLKLYNKVLDKFCRISAQVYSHKSAYTQKTKLAIYGEFIQYMTVTLFTVSHLAHVIKVLIQQLKKQFNMNASLQHIYPNLHTYIQKISVIAPFNKFNYTLQQLPPNIIKSIAQIIHKNQSYKIQKQIFIFYYYNRRQQNKIDDKKYNKFLQQEIKIINNLINHNKFYFGIIKYQIEQSNLQYIALQQQIIPPQELAINNFTYKKQQLSSRLNKNDKPQLQTRSLKKDMFLNIQSNLQQKSNQSLVKPSQYILSPIHLQKSASPIGSIRINPSFPGTPVSQSNNNDHSNSNNIYLTPYKSSNLSQQQVQVQQSNSNFKSSLKLRMTNTQYRQLKQFGSISKSKKKHLGLRSSLDKNLLSLSPKFIPKIQIQEATYKSVINDTNQIIQPLKLNNKEDKQQNKIKNNNNINRISKLNKLKQRSRYRQQGQIFQEISYKNSVVGQLNNKSSRGNMIILKQQIHSLSYLQEQSQKSSRLMTKRQQTNEQKSNDTISRNSLNCFIFTHKIKKQSLKYKVLIHKNQSLQIGMICDLQQEIIDYNKNLTKLFRLNVQFYTTIFLTLQKYHLNIQVPNWLKCISKININKQKIKSQTQISSSFKFQIQNKKKGQNLNFSQLMVLNIVYYDENNNKQVFSQILPILINKFTIQNKFTQDDFIQLIDKYVQITQVYQLMTGLSKDLNNLIHLYSEINYFSLDIPEQMVLFSKLEYPTIDQIAVIKLQYIGNHSQFILIFFQAQKDQQLPILQRKRIYFAIHFLKEEIGWKLQDRNMIEMIYRSILSQ